MNTKEKDNKENGQQFKTQTDIKKQCNEGHLENTRTVINILNYMQCKGHLENIRAQPAMVTIKKKK